MAEYRLYTLDDSRRILGCHEVVCADDRDAFIIAATLDDASAAIEIWHNRRFVGLAARRAGHGENAHRPLVTTVEGRPAPARLAPARLAPPRPGAGPAETPGTDEAPPGPASPS